LVKVFNAVPRKDALCRHVAESLSQQFDDRVLARRAARQRAMASFRAQHHAALLARDIHSNSQSRARSEGEHRCSRLRLAPAELEKIFLGKVGQRPRHCLEVIQDANVGEPKARAKFTSVNDPRIIGESAMLSFHYSCHGEYRVTNRFANRLTR